MAVIILIVIVIFILIYLLIVGASAMAGTTALSIQEFFLHTTWGLIAMISGILSLVFFFVSSKMPKAMRESKARVDSLAPVIHKLSNSNTKLTNIMSDELQEQVKELDLQNMSLEGFFRDVAFTINKPTAIIFKGWSNHRLRLDVEHVQILGQYLQEVRATSEEYLRLKADVFFSQEKFEYFVKTNAINAKYNIDLINEQYKDLLWGYEYKRKLQEADIKDREIAQHEKLALIKEQEARNEFFTSAIKDYPDMPPALKAYMFSQVHGRFMDSGRDFGMEEKIHEYIMKKNNIEIENMGYDSQMKKEEAKTFSEKMKYERKKKYD